MQETHESLITMLKSLRTDCNAGMLDIRYYKLTHKRQREPACDAQAAKGNPRKLITSGFSERSANYEMFCAMYIKILSSNIKITTR